MILVYIIVFMALLNLLRMASLLIISDIYNLKRELQAKRQAGQKPRGRPRQLPTFSIIVPAFNEESGILRTLRSLERLDYPREKFEIVVVNDGSTDRTAKRARRFIDTQSLRTVRGYLGRKGRGSKTLKRKYLRTPKVPLNVILVDQPNQGKAAALNNGIKNHSHGKLIMCLDADSELDTQALKNASRYFYDKSIAALASNVNIVEDGTVLGLTQRLEYIIAHQVKKAQTTANIDYIIGGIGSIFRRSILRKVKYYDTNTMTEDIDLTMKIVQTGNKKHRLLYASDVITYTEAVPTFKSLVKQRYRWKYGRLQAFLKNTTLFFNRDRKYSRLLTLFVLPSVLVQELIFLFEPFMIGFIIYNAFHTRSVAAVFSAMFILGVYALVNIWASEHLSVRERIRLSFYAPAIYILINIISLVDYLALIRSLHNLSGLKASIASEHVTWTSPERRASVA